MSMDIFTPTVETLLHETRVDFRLRSIQKSIHIVQYDRSLPVVAVGLMLNGFSYTLPNDAEVYIRWGKKDHTYVRKLCDVSSDKKTVYFEIDYQMVIFEGELNPILELWIGTKYAGSSPISVIVDRNPVQESDVESQTGDELIAEILDRIINLEQYKADLVNGVVPDEQLPPYARPIYTQSTTLYISEVKTEGNPSRINQITDGSTTLPIYDYRLPEVGSSGKFLIDNYTWHDILATDLPDNYGDDHNPYASKNANYILAAPNGSAGAPSFRALVAADLPSHYGDDNNPYASKTKNYVLAAPSNANGQPSFRLLVQDDIPTLSISKVDNLQQSLDSKVNKNADIAAGSNQAIRKISYDSKGLVTGSTVIDIATNTEIDDMFE